jgi:hypothetical protein
MQADVLFLDPNDLNPGTAALLEAGFDVVENLVDWIDEAGPTVFVRVGITSAIGEDDLLHWLQEVVEPFGGDVIEAGVADPAPPPPRATSPS